MYITSILTDIIGATSGPPPIVLRLGHYSSMLLIYPGFSPRFTLIG